MFLLQKMVYFEKRTLSFLCGQDVMNISVVLCCRSTKTSEVTGIEREVVLRGLVRRGMLFY